MALDVLVVGSGGREHALAWKLKTSPRIGKLYIAPGNGGTGLVGENVDINATDFEALAKFAEEKGIGLTVVGPDDPLALGIVDFFEKKHLRIWGPSKAAAQIEGSKAFSKQLMREAGIPTARFDVFNDYEAARAGLRRHSLPVVVKASGLALGKGVFICATYEEGEAALKEMMVDKVFKDSGTEVVIEEFLIGQEISVHAMCDGMNFVLFPASQDHKRALDGDKGKNTGGMGTIAPLPWLTENDISTIGHSIVRPTLEALAERGAPFKGLLYPGLILTPEGPKVLEYNARFGDPETQVYMRLLESDLLDLLEASVDGTIGNARPTWRQAHAANIVLASGGYPDAYKKGVPITGIEAAEADAHVVVFHAGTKNEKSGLVTSGGRVLGVSALGNTLKGSLDVAYTAAEKIHFEGKQFRTDIGAKSL
ncbi:phosphoribosylamine--glycine ligase [Candidatus Kaiserbacteria bacterium]|nr:phosphoribosylamine--glycine ligase [Candidatus Kaiserbacteria bacterium]